ncbi:hypothetical protein RIF29_41622 [Crotalaria pallida]|uniref:Uncharacterized protein n=1 Tax=Crotalaria pallida TaxID=3830 RepID=A0AAN9HSV8_CROPI
MTNVLELSKVTGVKTKKNTASTKGNLSQPFQFGSHCKNHNKTFFLNIKNQTVTPSSPLSHSPLSVLLLLPSLKGAFLVFLSSVLSLSLCVIDWPLSLFLSYTSQQNRLAEEFDV